VAKELEDQHRSKTSVNPYAYTNRAEYFAVLTEYMFERPGALERKNPELYGLLQAMFRQDTKSLLMEPFVRPHKLGRNSPCPCGSGKKCKHCCL
jgi:Mlc titration factor MtfA (ptsG expression regulator)